MSQQAWPGGPLIGAIVAQQRAEAAARAQAADLDAALQREQEQILLLKR